MKGTLWSHCALLLGGSGDQKKRKWEAGGQQCFGEKEGPTEGTLPTPHPSPTKLEAVFERKTITDGIIITVLYVYLMTSSKIPWSVSFVDKIF